MALLALEGFDGAGTTTGDGSYDNIDDYLRARYSSVNLGSGNNRVRLEDGWGSDYAMGWTRETNGTGNFIDIPTGGVSEVFCGFAIKPKQTITTTSETILGFRDNGGGGILNVALEVFNGSNIRFLRNNTVITGANAAGVLHQNRWDYVEIRVVFNNTTGIIECRVNGVEVVNVTGVDTLESTSTQCDNVRLRGANGSGFGVTDPAEIWLIDDVYVLDTTGSANNTFLGPIKIETLFPTAEGGTINFTPSTGTDNSANVDENPRDDDTTYNDSADTASNKDLFTAENLSVVTGGIVGVQVTSEAKLDAAGSIGLQSIVFENATQGTGSVQEVTDTVEYTSVKHIFETNPDTASAWAAAEVDAMEIGYEID